MSDTAQPALREKIEKLEIPKMVIWVDKEMKIETTQLTEKTVDEIMQLIAANQDNCNAVPDDQPNNVHIRYYNQGFKAGQNQLIDTLLEELPYRKGTSTHGNCCTCTTCKFPHDECECEYNEGVDQVQQLLLNHRSKKGDV
jgi:hypothetical protein